MRIQKYCVTFSEKQEDYDAIFGQFPQEQLSLGIHHVIFLTNNKLTLKLYIWQYRVCFLKNIYGKRRDLPFLRKSDRKNEKSVVSFTHEQNSICSPKLKAQNSWTTLRMSTLRICSCLACVYRVMDASGKFGEHERCVRVARSDSRVQL